MLNPDRRTVVSADTVYSRPGDRCFEVLRTLDGLAHWAVWRSVYLVSAVACLPDNGPTTETVTGCGVACQPGNRPRLWHGVPIGGIIGRRSDPRPLPLFS